MLTTFSIKGEKSKVRLRQKKTSKNHNKKQEKGGKKHKMVAISLTISAILAILLGLLVLVWPKVLRWAIGLYLIVFGVLQLISQI